MELTLQKAKLMMLVRDGDLWLVDSEYTGLPDGLVVNGNLDLWGSKIKKLPDNLFVSGWLNLCNTEIEELPKGLVVGGSIDMGGTKIKRLPEDIIIGGNLWMRNSQIEELPKNSTVGKNLDLRGTPIKELPENLAVGGILYLRNTQIATLPESLRVGEEVYGGARVRKQEYTLLEEGDYVKGRYLFANDALTHICRRKRVDGYSFYVGKIEGKNVISDGTHYSCCETLQQGVSSVTFMRGIAGGAEQYVGMTLDSVVLFDEAVAMYCVLTGAYRVDACQFLTPLGEKKRHCTVGEVAEAAKGYAGAERFARFFA